MNPNTIKDVLKRLEFRHHVITTMHTNKFTVISVSKWDKYQHVPDSTPANTPTRHQQDTTYQEVENKRIEKTFKKEDWELVHQRVAQIKQTLNDK